MIIFGRSVARSFALTQAFGVTNFQSLPARITWGSRISNHKPTQELFRGFEFRIDGARYIYFASVRIPNYFLPELRPNIFIVSGSMENSVWH